MKYKCAKTKEEILRIVVKYFYEASDTLRESLDDYDWGAYRMISKLVNELSIVEEMEKDGA